VSEDLWISVLDDEGFHLARSIHASERDNKQESPVALALAATTP
jgi:hypothetical protein